MPPRRRARRAAAAAALLLAPPRPSLAGCPSSNFKFVNDNRAFKVSQDCKFSLTAPAVERLKTPAQVYDLRSASAHTGFEQVGRSFVFLYRNLNNPNVLGLFWMHGTDNHVNGPGNNGARNYGPVNTIQPRACVWGQISQVPGGTVIAAQDDGANEFDWHNELGYAKAVPTHSGPYLAGRWAFAENTDGMTLDKIPLDKDWCMKIEVDFDNPGMAADCKGQMNDFSVFFADGTTKSVDPAEPLWLCYEYNPNMCSTCPYYEQGTFCGLAVDKSNPNKDITYEFQWGDGTPDETKTCPAEELCCITHGFFTETCDVKVSAKNLDAGCTDVAGPMDLASSACQITARTTQPSEASRGCIGPPPPPPVPPRPPFPIWSPPPSPPPVTPAPAPGGIPLAPTPAPAATTGSTTTAASTTATAATTAATAATAATTATTATTSSGSGSGIVPAPPPPPGTFPGYTSGGYYQPPATSTTGGNFVGFGSGGGPAPYTGVGAAGTPTPEPEGGESSSLDPSLIILVAAAAVGVVCCACCVVFLALRRGHGGADRAPASSMRHMYQSWQNRGEKPAGGKGNGGRNPNFGGKGGGKGKGWAGSQQDVPYVEPAARSKSPHDEPAAELHPKSPLVSLSTSGVGATGGSQMKKQTSGSAGFINL